MKQKDINTELAQKLGITEKQLDQLHKNLQKKLTQTFNPKNEK